MLEIVIAGRGGQGAVTAAELLANAAFLSGYYAQAFPKFGPERRGAPVEAYCRISEKEILLRSHIYEPDVLVILDEKLIEIANPKRVKKNGVIVLNGKKKPKTIKSYCVDATKIAIKHLGVPIVNTAMLGAVVKVLNKEFNLSIKIDKLEKVVKERFGKLAKKNVDAMEEAWEGVSQC